MYLHAFEKKSQGTPRRVISLARARYQIMKASRPGQSRGEE
jgi:phage-related protein